MWRGSRGELWVGGGGFEGLGVEGWSEGGMGAQYRWHGNIVYRRHGHITAPSLHSFFVWCTIYISTMLYSYFTTGRHRHTNLYGKVCLDNSCNWLIPMIYFVHKLILGMDIVLQGRLTNLTSMFIFSLRYGAAASNIFYSSPTSIAFALAFRRRSVESCCTVTTWRYTSSVWHSLTYHHMT